VPDRDVLLTELRSVLGADRVTSGNTATSVFGRDASLLRGEDPLAVCFPRSTEEVQRCVQACARAGVAFVPRGSGTGLAGGAVPVDETVVIVTTLMQRILSVDTESRVAWVEPGVVNLDLTRALHAEELHYGVTSAHVLALEVVLPDGDLVTLGGLDPEPAGFDLRGVFVGSEGTLGVATAVAVRLTPDPPAVSTMLVDFGSVEEAATCVSEIIARGIVPAAVEMMDARITRAVEEFVHAGFPIDAEAVLLVEVDGLPDGVALETAAVDEIAASSGARSVRVAADERESGLWWKGRKNAFGAVARVAPNYYLHDTVVPRTRLVEVLREVYAIADRHDLLVMNVFHAGDGNLHPLLVFDAREPGVLDRVHAAGEEIVDASLAAGGVLSGEHGIGLEKLPFMGRLFGADDLDAQARLRDAFDPAGRANPGKVLPAGSRCGEVGALPDGAWI
jgi:glycolate oxidase